MSRKAATINIYHIPDPPSFSLHTIPLNTCALYSTWMYKLYIVQLLDINLHLIPAETSRPLVTGILHFPSCVSFSYKCCIAWEFANNIHILRQKNDKICSQPSAIHLSLPPPPPHPI